MWADLQEGILEEFVSVHVLPADQSFFDMSGFRLIGEILTDERRGDMKRSAKGILMKERAALRCSECDALLSPPLKRGKRPTTCGGRCRLKRLYRLRKAQHNAPTA